MEASKPAEVSPDKQLAEELVERAREDGVDLVGPGGLLSGLTKNVLEAGLEAEMSEHLGYDKHEPAGRNRANSRNGTRAKKVLTDVGPVDIEVPRDRDGSFEPQLVKKRQRRLSGVDEMVISLTAKGLTTGEVSAHMAEVYGADVSSTPSRGSPTGLLGRCRSGRTGPSIACIRWCSSTLWWSRSATGRSPTGPYSAIGVTVDGERDILGLWVGNGGEGAKYWLQVLTEIKNRGVADVCIVVCDGLKGLPEAIETTWALAIVQTCVLHLIRNTFRFASKADWDQMARELRPVYTAVSEHDAKERFVEFGETWGEKYPAIIRLWENAWVEFVPFLDYAPEIRKVIYSTNAVESLHARMRRATRARGHFPTEQAALKCLYLVVRSLDPTGKGRKRWMNRWKAALNAFAITFEGRILPTEH